MTCELTILMPCLNEAETLETCIKMAQDFLGRNDIVGEVLVADNGSTDGSQAIATRSGARVVAVRDKGYGAAVLGGIRAAHGKCVIMGDADASYDFSRLDLFVEKLREGYELVMGNRFKGGIAPGAMPPLHKYLGNPVLSGIGRLFFRSPCKDFHCGLRGFNREAVMRLDLQTTGMEFASEMVVKASLHHLRIAEVPTTLSPDGRSRPPHLRSWRDGWRHLRFLLIYSPRWLFLYPGLWLTGLGLFLMTWLLPGTQFLFSAGLDIHTLVYASGMILVGLQMILFALFTYVHSNNLRLMPAHPLLDRLLRFTSLEVGIIAGVSLFAAGIAGSFYAVVLWQHANFGPQAPQELMRVVVPSVTALTCGVQMMFAAFFLSVLRLGHRPSGVASRDD
jgi:glycosyltransferase involved in cell wall biosynthesis